MGGLLIATKETGEWVEYYEWPVLTFAITVIIMAALVGANTVYFISRRRTGSQASSLGYTGGVRETGPSASAKSGVRDL